MSTGGGKGGGASRTLERISEEQFELIRPTLETAAGQVEELVRSGGMGALTPSVARAVESALSASSQAQRETQETLTRRNITGTDAARIAVNVAQQGEANVARIPSEVAFPIQQQAFAAALGLPQLAVQGLSGAASAQTAQADPFTTLLASLFGAGGQVAAAHFSGKKT